MSAEIKKGLLIVTFFPLSVCTTADQETSWSSCFNMLVLISGFLCRWDNEAIYEAMIMFLHFPKHFYPNVMYHALKIYTLIIFWVPMGLNPWLWYYYSLMCYCLSYRMDCCAVLFLQFSNLNEWVLLFKDHNLAC